MYRRISVLLLVLFFAGAVSAQQKRIYIANDDHTDYLWTADEPVYRQAFLEMLDYYLNLADQTAANPPDFRSRFSADGSFWVRVFEKNRTAAEFERLIGRVADGSMSVPLTLLNLAYGAMPAEAVLRSMYYAGRLERTYGLRLKMALAQENQTLPFGLGTLFAGAGASYFWKGICGCATQVPDAWDRPLDMYWWTGLDGSRILTKWNSQIRHNFYDIGGYAEARNPSEAIDFVSSDAEFQARHPYGVIGLFGYGGDDLKTFTDLFVQTAQAKSNGDRRVIVSNTVDFFEDFAATYGAVLPSQSLGFGNEWDLLSASMSGLSARVKRATEKLRTAEILAALVSLRDMSFMRGRESAGESAWIDLGMYYDHDWTADGPVTRDRRAAWQRERAAGIETYVEDLYGDARTALGGMIAKGPVNSRYYVFNPLGWARTGPVDLPYSSSGNVHVVDNTTGLEVPSQVVTAGSQSVLRVWAAGVPSAGYKTFDIVSGAPAAFSGGPTASGDTLENAYYRVRVGTNGSILSLVDKLRGGWEMVGSSGERKINDLGPGGGTISVESAGPVSATLLVSSSGPLVHTTAITLYRDSSRIDIRNDILQNFGDVRTWDFNVNLDSPILRHEEIGAVLLADRAAGGGHYASQAARCDWLSLNHFADLTSDGIGLTVSSPDLSFLRRGSSTAAFLDVQTPRISILAGGQVDGTSLGIPNQGGDSEFLQRFALETHGAYDQAAAMRFALEHQNPLIAGEVTGGAAYPGASFSLFSVTVPGVFVWAVKPAEDTVEGGIVVRLWNQASPSADFSLLFDGFTVVDAKRTSLIETPLQSAAFQPDRVSDAIPGFGWRSYHLKLNGDAVSPGIVVISPNGGETWTGGTERSLAWTTSGTVPDVKLEYSINGGSTWTVIAASTPNTNSYVWTVPEVVSVSCLVRVSGAAAGTPADVSNAVFTILTVGIPALQLSRTAFAFGAVRNGALTPPETSILTNSGTGTLNWTAAKSSDWIEVLPGSGLGGAVLTIGVSRTDLGAGTYAGTVTVSDPAAVNSPQVIDVTYQVFDPGTDAAPFGIIETPAPGAVVVSSIAVTGWALDDIGMQSVKVYRGTGLADRVFIGEATFVEGARMDVVPYYPNYPQNTRAGWGYMLLTNFLPDGGNGEYNLLIYAADVSGHEVLLGERTIICDNAHATLPFGAIDTPAQGGTAAGSGFFNFGWALTPQPNFIPTDGSTILVWMNGAALGHPTYNYYRGDIAALFPGYVNSNGAVGLYTLDTTGYPDVVHNIAWSVQDSAGNIDGIGSRFFSISNLAGGAVLKALPVRPADDFAELPEDTRTPVFLRRGLSFDAPAEMILPEEDGSVRIDIAQVTRVAVYLNEVDSRETEGVMVERGARIFRNSAASDIRYEAYRLVFGELWPLPIGASLDARDGVLYWQPGPGFLGDYLFVIVDGLTATRKTIKINIR